LYGHAVLTHFKVVFVCTLDLRTLWYSFKSNCLWQRFTFVLPKTSWDNYTQRFAATYTKKKPRFSSHCKRAV